MKDKQIDLDNAYTVTLYDNKRFPYIQVIEAESCDHAIYRASRSFSARLHGLNDKNRGSATQKCCKHTSLLGRLRFCFKGGWTTIDCSGLSIFEALEVASKSNFVKGLSITEIESPIYYTKENR